MRRDRVRENRPLLKLTGRFLDGSTANASGQVFWLMDHSRATGLPTRLRSGPVSSLLDLGRLRPHLQRRDRGGFAPPSLAPEGSRTIVERGDEFNPSLLDLHRQGLSMGSSTAVKLRLGQSQNSPRRFFGKKDILIAMDSKPKVSVLVAARNEGSRLESCLDAVLKAAEAAPWKSEILVALANPEDAAVEETLKRKSASLRFLSNPEKIAAAGLNAAYREARGDFIMRIDARTIVAPDYLVECVRLLEREDAEAVGGRQAPVGRGPVGRAVACLSTSPLGNGGASYRKVLEPGAQPRAVDTVYLGAWPRRIFEALGGFDETLPQNQDEEFAFRIRRHGGRVLLSDSIKSSYEARESLAAIAAQYFRFGRFKPLVLLRHPSEARWRHLIPAMTVCFFLALAVLSWWQPVFSFAAGVLALIWIALHVGAACATPGKFGLAARALVPAVAFLQQAFYGLGFLTGLAKVARAPAPKIPAVSAKGETRRLQELYRERDRRHPDRYSEARPEVKAERGLRRKKILELFTAQDVALEGRRTLEVGIGHGDFANDLIICGVSAESYSGIDLSASRLEGTRTARGFGRLAQATSTALPFREGSFDLVVFATILSSIRNEAMRRKTLDEADRVLSPGGLVLIYDLSITAPGRDWVPIDMEELRRIWGAPVAEEKLGLAPVVWRALGPLRPLTWRSLMAARINPFSSHRMLLFKKEARSSNDSPRS